VRRNKNKENINLVILFGLYILAFLNTKEYYPNFLELQQHLFFLLMPLLFSYIQINKKTKITYSLVFCLGTLITVLSIDIIATFDYFFYNNNLVHIHSSTYNRFFSYGLTSPLKDVHPTYLATFLNLTFFLVVKYFKELRLNKIMYIFLLVFITINILLLLSITAIISYILLLLYLFFYKKEQRKNILILCFVLFSFSFINKDQFKKIKRLTEIELKAEDKGKDTHTLNIRLAKWKTSIQVISKNLIVGVSPGEIKSQLVSQYIKNGYMFCAEKKFGPHNQYLTYFMSFGLIGLLIFIYLLMNPLPKGGEMYKIFFSLLLLVILTEDFLERQQGIFFFSVFYQFFARDNS
jgi:O-antigen ligase